MPADPISRIGRIMRLSGYAKVLSRRAAENELNFRAAVSKRTGGAAPVTPAALSCVARGRPLPGTPSRRHAPAPRLSCQRSAEVARRQPSPPRRRRFDRGNGQQAGREQGQAAAPAAAAAPTQPDQGRQHAEAEPRPSGRGLLRRSAQGQAPVDGAEEAQDHRAVGGQGRQARRRARTAAREGPSAAAAAKGKRPA